MVHGLAGLKIVAAHRIDGWPIGRAVLRKLSIDRIDAECEQAFKFLMQRPHLKRCATHHVPVERFKMAKIKDDAVPFGNRPVIEGLLINYAENGIRLTAPLFQLRAKRRLDAVCVSYFLAHHHSTSSAI